MTTEAKGLTPLKGVELQEAVALPWTQDQVELIKNTVAVNTTDDELRLFLYWCHKQKVDPLTRQAHCVVRKVKRKDRKGRDVMVDGKPVYDAKAVFMLGIDGILDRANAFPDYLGYSSGVVYANDEFKWDNIAGKPLVHISGTKNRGELMGAWISVHRKGKHDTSTYLEYLEFADSYSPLWKGKKAVMIEKCAVAMGHRRAYPGPFGNAYIPEEFGGAWSEKDKAPQLPEHVTDEPVEGIERKKVHEMASEVRVLLKGSNAERRKLCEKILGHAIAATDLERMTYADLKKIRDKIMDDQQEAGDPEPVESPSDIEPDEDKRSHDPGAVPCPNATCSANVVYTKEENGDRIPLDPETGEIHDCKTDPNQGELIARE